MKRCFYRRLQIELGGLMQGFERDFIREFCTSVLVSGDLEREAALVMELVAGKTLREAADSLGMSYYSARTHIANASGWAGLRPQTDLVRVAAGAVSTVPKVNGMD